MVNQFEEKHFGFLPRTFIVPQDKEELVQVMQEKKMTMIIKPPNWFCGIGIKLIDKIGEVTCSGMLY
jgi:glutathione synthase/RimK-type ligase-like ATP-grasp enzyme